MQMYTVSGGLYINVGVVNKERVATVPHKLSFPAQFRPLLLALQMARTKQQMSEQT